MSIRRMNFAPCRHYYISYGIPGKEREVSTRPLHILIRHLRQAASPAEVGTLTDAQLLERWAGQRDEAAFELLLWRHGPMVLAACRRLVSDAQIAEDAFQATWLVLVRKAGSLRRREAVAAWLHRVACRVALRVRASSRPEGRLGPGVDVPAPPHPEEAAAHDLRRVLDEELDCLPKHYRQAFVLCCLEEKTHAEAARELGCPQGTLSSWLARARERLRARLTRRGVSPAAAGLATGLAAGASAGVPAALVVSMVKAATQVAAGGAVPAGLVSARATTLIGEVLRAMRMAKLKVALAAFLLLIGSVAGLLTYQSQAQQPVPAEGVGSTPAPPPAQAGQAAAWSRWEYKALTRTGVQDLGHDAKDGDQLTSGLNRLGAQGWKLVAVDPGVQTGTGATKIQTPSTYVFRRPSGARAPAPSQPAVGPARS
jgi:RNA polymerase sigma factor (sigma-70 family)